jgi:hypothetical protein
VNLLFTDTPFPFETSFQNVARYADSIRATAFDALDEEAILIARPQGLPFRLDPPSLSGQNAIWKFQINLCPRFRKLPFNWPADHRWNAFRLGLRWFRDGVWIWDCVVSAAVGAEDYSVAGAREALPPLFGVGSAVWQGD